MAALAFRWKFETLDLGCIGCQSMTEVLLLPHFKFVALIAVGARAFTLDATNRMSVGLDLYTVAPRHQADLVAAVREQIAAWKKLPQFCNAAIHQSIDGLRVFTYSQWLPRFDHRTVTSAPDDFFIPESQTLEVTASRSVDPSVTVTPGNRLTHLAEFRMSPAMQPEMIKLTTEALDTAMDVSPGLISATFHRSFDGTRIFNYGQWTSEEAFKDLERQDGFSKEAPYWKGLARNEFHLYNVVYVLAANSDGAGDV
ncbi:MAG: antibiotic biosynthesis monooxygenase [Cyanobacteria bacterium P01_F01_bin.3]